MDLSTLTNTELTEALLKLVGKERGALVIILQHLGEVDQRRLYLEAGYSSLFTYSVSKLKYSEASAQRRIAAARCLREHPELEGMIIEGSVNLCTVALAAEGIRKSQIKVEEIAGKSKKEVISLVAEVNPLPSKPREVVMPVVVKKVPDSLSPACSLENIII